MRGPGGGEVSGAGVRRAPGDHPITIAPFRSRVVVRVGGTIVAATTRALELEEAGYRPVLYVPADDVELHLLTRSERRTVCPHKGEASYYGIVVDGAVLPDAVWTYEAPHAAVAAIAGHLAFYRDRVTIDVDPAETAAGSAP